MKMRFLMKKLLILITIAFWVLSPPAAKAQPVKGTFLYNLSNFTGPISFSWPRIFIDQERNEVYVLYQNFVRIFNVTGMEVYRFGDELDLGSIIDITLDRDGNILLLSHKWSEASDRVNYEITRCNYRGKPESKIDIRNFPPELSKFLPTRMIYREANLYLASLAPMIVVVTDSEGVFKEVYDILSMLELEEKEKEDAKMGGFSFDKEGNFLFTMPLLFRAYKISPDRKVTYFGKPGGAPGRFNIVAGIAADNRGNILVADKLKCSVMVYDKNLNFLNQFSSRGWKPGFLIAPEDIAIDKQDRVYVTQAGNKGISVFKMTYN
jgi:hypothetical protein